jgi:hypothetical protein
MALEERKTFGNDPLKKHIKCIIYTGFVDRHKPVSTLIFAEPERGKTVEVMKFNALGVVVFNDLTAYGLQEELVNMGQIEREVFHHIIIPDLERIGARSWNSKQELLATLQIAMQEGLYHATTRYTHVDFQKPKVIGAIMCTTPREMKDKRSIFRRESFLSRVIPFSYNYSNQKRADIFQFIVREEKVQKEKFDISIAAKEEVLMPVTFKEELIPYSRLLASSISDFTTVIYQKDHKLVKYRPDLIGARTLEQLICYVKALALANGRPIVMREDFEEFEELFRYFNFDMEDM